MNRIDLMLNFSIKLSPNILLLALMTTSSSGLAAPDPSPKSADPDSVTDATETEANAPKNSAESLAPVSTESATEETVEPDVETENTEAGAEKTEPQGKSSSVDEKPGAKKDQAKKQEEEPYRGPGTLLTPGGRKMDLGGYGGLHVLATGINGQAAMLMGAEGGFLFDHRFILGLGGYGLTSMVDTQPFSNGDRSLLIFGYGGPIIRYQFIGKGPVSLSLGALIGGGGMSFLRETSDNYWDIEEGFSPGQAFFVFDPSVQAHVHLTRWMRLGADFHYRLIQGANARGITDRDLSGFSGGGHIEFGWF